MKLISHRGNINGRVPQQENSPDYIKNAINLGFDVEIDVRILNEELYLGHDNPDYKIDISWLKNLNENLWIHTKDFESLNYLISYNWAKIFYHQHESHTIINNTNLIWSHNLNEAKNKSIIPLLNLNDIESWTPKKVYGICSDYINILKK